MNRICKCEVQKLFPILEAIKEGKTIQFKDSDGWRDINGDDEGFYLNTLVEETDKYRIKPEPKYRPFANAEECWQEMQKHQPFGWITYQCAFFHVIYIEDKSIGYGSACGTILHSEFNYAFKNYTFADGTPFGVKLEE